MQTPDGPSERADAIFEALNVSESDEQAKEAAKVEVTVQRMARVRERVETEKLRPTTTTGEDVPGLKHDDAPDLGVVAEEAGEKSVEEELDSVGHAADTSDLVPPDNAQ